MAASAIWTDKHIYGTIYIIVHSRVCIFPFNVNQCDVNDTQLPHGAAEASFRPVQRNDRSAEHDTILESYANIDSNKFKKGNTLHKLRCAA